MAPAASAARRLKPPLALGKALAVGGGVGLVAGIGLGILARVAMRLLAIGAGLRPGASVGGTLEVVATGVLIGGAVGVIYGSIRRWLPPRLWARGLVVGVALAVFFSLYQPPAARSALSGTGHGTLALGLFAICFVGYGWLLEWMFRRLPRSS